MALIEENCTPLVGHCIVMLFRDLCIRNLDPDAEERTTIPRPPTLAGSIQISNIEGEGTLIDPNGAIFTSCPIVQTFNYSSWQAVEVDGCQYWAVKSCILPANIDSDFDADAGVEPRALTPLGTTYTLNLQVGTKTFNHEFQIDAAADYSDIEVCDCIPVLEITIDNPTPVIVGNPFVDLVCDSIHAFNVSESPLPADGSVSLVGADSNGDCQLYQIDPCQLLISLAPTDISLADSYQQLVITYDSNGVPAGCDLVSPTELCNTDIQSGIAQSFANSINGGNN